MAGSGLVGNLASRASSACRHYTSSRNRHSHSRVACAWSGCCSVGMIQGGKPLFNSKSEWRAESRGIKMTGGANLEAAVGGTDEPASSSRKSLKSRLRAGEKLYGAFLASFSSVVAEIMGYGGYDFLVVDMEHGPGDTMSALPILQTLAGTGTPAILRLPVNDPVWVKKAMDLGPAGLMFPMIEDAEQASRAVAASRYPPAGIRGAAHAMVRASRYGLDAGYLDKCAGEGEEDAEEVLIMCQVESRAAVERIPEIAAVKGVDCIQMGPTDLRASLGLLRNPADRTPEELLRAAEKAVLSSGRRVYLAGFATPADSPGFLFQQGYGMVSGCVDVCLLRDAVVEDLKKNKHSWKPVS